MLFRSLGNGLGNIRYARSRRFRAFRIRFLGLTHQLVRLFLRHLSATYHVLHEVARTFYRESGEAGSRTDDVFHRGGNLASRLLTDFLCARRHLGDRVSNVGAAVSRWATGSHRSGGRSWIQRSGRFGGQWLVGHGWSHSECAYMKGPEWAHVL